MNYDSYCIVQKFDREKFGVFGGFQLDSQNFTCQKV